MPIIKDEEFFNIKDYIFKFYTPTTKFKHKIHNIKGDKAFIIKGVFKFKTYSGYIVVEAFTRFQSNNEKLCFESNNNKYYIQDWKYDPCNSMITINTIIMRTLNKDKKENILEGDENRSM